MGKEKMRLEFGREEGHSFLPRRGKEVLKNEEGINSSLPLGKLAYSDLLLEVYRLVSVRRCRYLNQTLQWREYSYRMNKLTTL